jgi:hypothetical protein
LLRLWRSIACGDSSLVVGFFCVERERKIKRKTLATTAIIYK